MTAERIRQIVREALGKRLLDEETDHAKLQLARLGRRCASLPRRSPTAISKRSTRCLRFLDRLDRYQRTAKVNQVYDDEARQKLLDNLNRAAANLGYDQDIAAFKAAAERGARIRAK